MKIKENAYELIRDEIKNQKLLDFIIKNQGQEIEYEETEGGLYRIWLNDFDYVDFEKDDKIFEEEFEEFEEETEETKLTRKEKIITVTILLTIIAGIFLWFKYGVKPLDESDMTYIKYKKIDSSIYNYERDISTTIIEINDLKKALEKKEAFKQETENHILELKKQKNGEN